MPAKKSIIRFFLKNLANERKLTFHSKIFKQKFLKKFDNFLLNDKWPQIHKLFINAEKYVNLNSLDEISNEVKKRRRLGRGNRMFINKLAKSIQQSKGSCHFVDVYSNFLHMGETIDSLEEIEISETLRYTILLWAYLTVLENSLAIISQLFYFVAQDGKNKDDTEFIEAYNKYLNKGEHLLFKRLKEYAEKKGFIEKEGDTILHQPNLRNSIAHGEIFYDSGSKKLVARNRKYTKKEFKREFKKVFDFHVELIYQLMNKQSDIKKKIMEEMTTMANMAKMISRSGTYQRNWKIWKEKNDANL